MTNRLDVVKRENLLLHSVRLKNFFFERFEPTATPRNRLGTTKHTTISLISVYSIRRVKLIFSIKNAFKVTVFNFSSVISIFFLTLRFGSPLLFHALSITYCERRKIFHFPRERQQIKKHWFRPFAVNTDFFHSFLLNAWFRAQVHHVSFNHNFGRPGDLNSIRIVREYCFGHIFVYLLHSYTLYKSNYTSLSVILF